MTRSSGPDPLGTDPLGTDPLGPDPSVTSGADHRDTVAAVIVTYRPDLERFETVLGAAGPQVRSLVVVDNGSPDACEIARLVDAIPTARLVALEENHGIAAGFNAGIAAALSGSPEIEWVLTLDQDSVLDGAAVSTALDCLATLQHAISRRCGVIGLRHRPVTADRGLWRLAERRLDLGDLGTFRRRLLLISSGNLVRSEVAESCRFDERLFIDQVDYDFCAEVRDAGFELFELKQVLMDHRIGRDVPLLHRPELDRACVAAATPPECLARSAGHLDAVLSRPARDQVPRALHRHRHSRPNRLRPATLRAARVPVPQRARATLGWPPQAPPGLDPRLSEPNLGRGRGRGRAEAPASRACAEAGRG
jgi:hypothetical protein